MRHTAPLHTDAEFHRVLRGYGLALLFVACSHGALWYWSQRKPIETLAIVPQMVDVELIAPPKEPRTPPPAATPPTPHSRPAAAPQPLSRPKPQPPPKRPEPAPQPPKKTEAVPKLKKAEPAPETERDDLAERFRELRESLGAKSAQPPVREAPSRTQGAPPRPGNPPRTKPAGGARSDQKATGAQDAAYLHNPKPRYPAIAIARNWEGVVKLRVNVLPNGTAGQVQLAQSSGHDALDEAALEVVRRWRFVPAKRGDTPIASWVHVPLVFKLDAAH